MLSRDKSLWGDTQHEYKRVADEIPFEQHQQDVQTLRAISLALRKLTDENPSLLELLEGVVGRVWSFGVYSGDRYFS